MCDHLSCHGTACCIQRGCLPSELTQSESFHRLHHQQILKDVIINELYNNSG